MAVDGDTLHQLARWWQVQDAMMHLAREEKALREQIFAKVFPNPKEGTNKEVLPAGAILKGTYKINRTVVEEQFSTLPKALRTSLFKTKHELILKPYRELDEETMKAVDSILIVKPGLPSLEVVPAKVEEGSRE